MVIFAAICYNRYMDEKEKRQIKNKILARSRAAEKALSPYAAREKTACAAPNINTIFIGAALCATAKR